MSAQDVPIMFDPAKAKRWGTARSLVALLGEAVWAALREAKQRHDLWKLPELDDEQLKDYGVTRSEIIAALEQPLTTSASRELSRARRARALRLFD